MKRGQTESRGTTGIGLMPEECIMQLLNSVLDRPGGKVEGKRFVKPASKTPKSALHDYILHLRARNYSSHTIYQGRLNIERCLNWLAETRGVTTCADLGRCDLQMWQRYLLERTSIRKAPLLPRSINRYLCNMKGFLRFLARTGYLHEDILSAIVRIKEPRMLPSSVLTHRQVRNLLACIHTDTAEGYRTRTILEILYSTGIRASELLGLDLDDVDFRYGIITVTGKGRKQRQVPVGRIALEFLRNYVREARPKLLGRRSDRGLILDDSGKRMPYYTLRRIVDRCARAACIGIKVTPHTFRRTCTTELLRNGAGVYHLKELVGHESLDTLKHYARLTINDVRKAHRKQGLWGQRALGSGL